MVYQMIFRLVPILSEYLVAISKLVLGTLRSVLVLDEKSRGAGTIADGAIFEDLSFCTMSVILNWKSEQRFSVEVVVALCN